MKNEKKSRYYGQLVKAVSKINGKMVVREGILRGYYKSLVYIDTGELFFEQFLVGTAPGHWLIMPSKTKIEIVKVPAESKEVVTRKKMSKRAIKSEIEAISFDSEKSDWQPETWQQELEDLPEFYPITPMMDAEAYNELFSE